MIAGTPKYQWVIQNKANDWSVMFEAPGGVTVSHDNVFDHNNKSQHLEVTAGRAV
jgi:hypothetical protein